MRKERQELVVGVLTATAAPRLTHHLLLVRRHRAQVVRQLRRLVVLVVRQVRGLHRSKNLFSSFVGFLFLFHVL